MLMPTLNKHEQAAKDATDKVLTTLLSKGARTLGQLGCTRHRLNAMLDAKLIKRAGTVKVPGSGARSSVAFELTVKGRKRAARPTVAH